MRWEGEGEGGLEGRGGENYFSVSSAKLLLNLLMEFFKFSSPYSPCGQEINGGIMVLVG